MRLCVLAKVTLFHSIGGMQVHCQRLVEGLKTFGHDVVLVTTSHPDGRTHDSLGGIDIRYVSEAAPGLYSRGWWSGSVTAVRALHAANPFDAILSEEIAGTAVARGGPPLPHFIFLQGIILEHLVSEFHQAKGLTGFSRYLWVKIPEMLYYTFCHEAGAVRSAEGVFVVSDRLARLVPRWFRVASSRVHVARNWIDCQHFRPDQERRSQMRARLGITPRAPVMLMASVLTRQKGVQIGLRVLAESARTVPDLTALIVGDGPYRHELEQEASALGLGSRARFVGQIENDATAGYHNAADLFLFPSLRLEGVPYVVLEAMASGLPIVAASSGNLPEVLGDGQCGRLVTPGQVEEFSRAVEELARDPALREKLGRAARQRAVAYYSGEAVVPAVLNVIAPDVRARVR